MVRPLIVVSSSFQNIFFQFELLRPVVWNVIRSMSVDEFHEMIQDLNLPKYMRQRTQWPVVERIRLVCLYS